MSPQQISLLFLLILSLASAPAQGLTQDNTFPWPETQAIHRATTPTPQQLEKELEEALGIDITLKLKHRTQSMLGVHRDYEVLFEETPVYGFPVKVNALMDGSCNVITPKSIPWLGLTTTLNWGNLGNAKQGITLTDGTPIYSAIKHCLPESSKLIPGWKIEYMEDNLPMEGFMSNERQLIYSRSLVHFSKPDTGRAMVFLPDPLTSAQTIYGGNYIDRMDSNLTILNQWMQEVRIPITYDSGSFKWKLESDYCRIVSITPPQIAPPQLDTTDFFFGRGDEEFEAVNAYYHINQMQEYIQSLGFDSVVNYPLEVDANGMGGNDQSAFFESGPRIEFGTGGVDDAEDADVVVHEYGHAILHSCAPGTNIGSQRQALDEGLGDYLAVSYSLQFSDFNAYEVFNWDGHNEHWDGREAKVDRTYPTDLTNNIYGDGELWASSLMEVQERLGRRLTDSLLFNSLCSYFPGMTLVDAMHFFLQADSLLSDTANSDAIVSVFCNRGLYPGCEDTLGTNQLIDGPFLSNSENFATSDEAVIINPNGYEVTYWELFALNGTLLAREDIELAERFYYLQWPTLRNGLYILQVGTTTGEFGFKLIRQAE